ncbi:MAG TPA: hypothetical protein VIN75_14165, partial [Burkholderiaceae bacterium]
GTLRDRAGLRGSRFKQFAYGILALGWRGEARHWARHETAYLLLAELDTKPRTTYLARIRPADQA